MSSNVNQIICIADPFCGWCYAAAPILDKLAAEQGITLTLMHRALFTGPMTRWMSRRFSDYVMQADRRVAELSGQVFSRAYRENQFYRDHLIIDSWPTAKALQVIRRFDEQQVIPFFRALQQARFIEGKVITDSSVLCELAASVGLQADLFHQQFHYDSRIEESARLEQQRSAELMQQAQTDGVPCFLLQQGQSWLKLPHSPWLNNPEGFIDALRQQIN